LHDVLIGCGVAEATGTRRTTVAHHASGIRRITSCEHLKTVDILALHEKVFAPLDPRAKRRIAHTASVNGWDRTWDDDIPAAA
jgi:hypothetical protein